VTSCGCGVTNGIDLNDLLHHDPAMRTLFVSGFLWLGLVMSSAAEGISAGDRQRLLAHLDMTEQWLVSEVETLTPQQATFEMSPDSWSILEVVEHLGIAEPQYWQRAQDSMKQPPPDKKPETTDAQILWYGIDRTNRTKTGEARVPTGKFKDVKEALAAVRTLRATIRDYAATTQEDLRGRILTGGNMDVYQWLLMISTHSQRHILQIREVKAHPKYPK
jgi:DinB superfamily